MKEDSIAPTRDMRAALKDIRKKARQLSRQDAVSLPHVNAQHHTPYGAHVTTNGSRQTQHDAPADERGRERGIPESDTPWEAFS